MAEDGSITLRLGIDDKDAERELKRLATQARNLEESLASKGDKRSIIVDRLRHARSEAEALKAKLQELLDMGNLEEKRTDLTAQLTTAQNRVTAANSHLASKQRVELDRAERLEEARNALEQARANPDANGENVRKAEEDLALAQKKYDSIIESMGRYLTQLREAQKEVARLTAEIEKIPSDDDHAKAISGTQSALKAANAEVAKYERQEQNINDQIELQQRELERVGERQTEINSALAQQSQQAMPEVQQATQTAMDGVKESARGATEEVQETTRNAAAGAKEVARTVTIDTDAAMASVGKSLKKGFRMLLKYGLGIRSTYILFRKLRSLVTEGIKEYANYDAETKKNVDDLKASLNGLKGAFVGAIAPIYNAVAPALKVLIDKLTAAMNVVTMFIAILQGKSTYKKAIANANDAASAVSGVGKAAEETKRQLSGLDEMSIWSESSSSSGGGGGGSSSGSGMKWVEEAVDADGFAGKLALTFQNVFMDWEDISPEQWAQKINVLLGGIAGGILGLEMAGVGGAIVGTIAGIALTMLFNADSFNNDGELSEDEVFNLLNKEVLPALAGGILGFALGGPWGAGIGATIALGLAFELDKNGISFSESAVGLGAVGGLAELLGIGEEYEKAGGWSGFVEAWNEDIEHLQEGWEKIQKWWDEVVKPLWDNHIKPWFQNPFGLDNGKNPEWLENIRGLVADADKWLTEFLDGTWWQKKKAEFQQSIANGEGEGSIGSLFSILFGEENLGDKIVEALKNAWEAVKSFLTSGASGSVTSSLANGILTVTRGRKNSVAGAGSAGVSSSSPWADWVKTNVLDPLFDSIAVWLPTKISELVDSIWPTIQRAWNEVIGWIEEQLGINLSFLKFDIDATAKITDVNDSELPESKRNVKTKAKLTELNDSGLTAKQKSVTLVGYLEKYIRSDYWKNNYYDYVTLTGYLKGFVRSSDWYSKGYDKLTETAYINEITITQSALNKLKNKLSVQLYAYGAAFGGVFRNGVWHSIQSFAGGGSPYGGQIFRARENGNPELVGTLRGSTAVMNNNQIVASVSSGVAKAIAGISWKLRGMPAMTSDIIPAIARGSIIPPQVATACTDLEDIKNSLNALANLLGNRNSGGQYQFTAQINRRTLFDELIAEAELRRSQNGLNPFLAL